jgi:acetoin utilization deacetylase AcuC-like enzyme
LGTFKITHSSFTEFGRRIAALNLPTVIVMEGGYANEALGTNTVNLLEGFR